MLANSPRLLNYRAGTTFLHGLDARTKLVGAVALVATVLIASSPTTLVLAYMLGGLAGGLAFTLLGDLWKSLRPLLLLIALFGVVIVIVTPGHALAHIWIPVPSTQGVKLAVRLALQAFLIVYTTSLLTLTTPPLAIAGAMEWALGFLQRFRVPVHDIIAMVAIGLTFVPLLIEETQKVMAAQRARGANLGMNSLLDEQSMGALLIPLLLANLRRGSELAESMDSRLYGTGPRTALRDHRAGRADYASGAVLVGGLLAVVALSILKV
jgi:energy-coupling factor transport system permease protein